jgi:hypothetical protein
MIYEFIVHVAFPRTIRTPARDRPVIDHSFRTGHLVGIFMLCCVLFSYPFLTLFNIRINVFGIPLLYIYIFAAWFGSIFLIFIATRARDKSATPESSDAFLEHDSKD